MHSPICSGQQQMESISPSDPAAGILDWSIFGGGGGNSLSQVLFEAKLPLHAGGTSC